MVSPLKEAAGTKKQINELVAAMKKFEVDASLLSTLPAVAAKAPDARGDFDQLTFNNLEAALNSKGENFSAGVHAAEPRRAQCAAAVEAAKAAFNAAKEALHRSEEGLSAAEKEISEAQGDLKKAGKSNDNFEAEMKVAEANVSKTKKALHNFQTGPAEAFASLKVTAAPVPEPEPVEEEPSAAA